MPGTIEERVAYLEGKTEEHSRAWVDLKDSINHLDQRIIHLDQRVTFLDQKVDRFRDELSTRIDGLDQKVDRFRDELSARITELDNRLNARIDGLDHKISKFSLWIIGIQVTAFMAMIAVFLRVAGGR